MGVRHFFHYKNQSWKPAPFYP